VRVCVGGTFNVLHAGHTKLLRKAIEIGDFILVGLTTDDFANKQRVDLYSGRVTVKSYECRERKLACFLEKELKDTGKTFQISPLSDPHGAAVQREDLDAIVVTRETEGAADTINEIRAGKGYGPLKVEVIPYILAWNMQPISASKVHLDRIDTEGNPRTVRVGVASENPVKIAAVEEVFRIFFHDVEMVPLAVDSGVPEQPYGKDIIIGARNRALAFFPHLKGKVKGTGVNLAGYQGENGITVSSSDLGETPDEPVGVSGHGVEPEKLKEEVVDFSVGVEAGLLRSAVAQQMFDVQFCAVLDPSGNITFGHGSGFTYPTEVLRYLDENPGATVGQAFKELYSIYDSGRRMGAIGVISNGILNRKDLTKQCVFTALLPRFKNPYFSGILDIARRDIGED